MDKLSSSEGIAHLKSILSDSGYTSSQINTWIDKAKNTAAIELAKAENRDYQDEDVIKELKAKYKL